MTTFSSAPANANGTSTICVAIAQAISEYNFSDDSCFMRLRSVIKTWRRAAERVRGALHELWKG